MATLYVSSKIHDTLKKPREILMVSYAVRFPELAAKLKGMAGEVDMDPAVRTITSSSLISERLTLQAVEADRQRILTIERLILETVCFNFTMRVPFPYVIKIGHALKGTSYPSPFVDGRHLLVPSAAPAR